jgi:hypothetical protein
MSCVFVLLMAIDVVVIVVLVDLSFGECLCPSFTSKEVGVTSKVPESVTIVVLVGLYLWELSYHHLVVTWAYVNPYESVESFRSCTLGTYPRQ